MNMADVAQTNLVAFDPINYDSYQDGGGSGKSFAPPPEGRYTGKAPIIKDDGSDTISENNSFGRTAEGYLKLNLDGVELLDGPNPGYKIRFQTISSKKMKNREASQVLDFLRACGVAARPTNEKELRQACKLASGRPFQFQLNWEAYNKDTQENYTILDAARDAQGNTLSYVTDPYDSQKRWFFNGKIRYFVSALKQA